MCASRSDNIVRTGAVLLLGVFFVNLYLVLYDTNLNAFQPLHYYLNLLISITTLVASLLLFVGPKSPSLISLAGIVWPLVYLGSLSVNVESRLCLGAGTNCIASVNDAFEYLILNDPSAGWKLFQGTIPIAIVLLVATIGLSLFALTIRDRKMLSVSRTNDKEVQPESLERPILESE